MCIGGIFDMNVMVRPYKIAFVASIEKVGMRVGQISTCTCTKNCKYMVYVTHFSYRDSERCHHLEVAVRAGGLVVCVVT